MKLSNAFKKLAAVFTVAITANSFAAHAANIPGVTEQPSSYFYTGKPYDKDLCDYTFAYRNYNPEINRWTSVDPSGFPDGPNANIYAAIPTTGIDATGLWAISLTSNRTFNQSASPTSVIDTGGHAIPFFTAGSAASSIYAGTPAESGSISAYASASYIPYGSTQTATVDINISASLAVDSNGRISITRDPGTWGDVSLSATIGALMAYTLSSDGKTLSVEYSVLGGYKASGLSGTGLSVSLPAGAGGGGASLSFTGSSGFQNVVVGTLTFKAVE